MTGVTAASFEGLEDRSITHYDQDRLQQLGVRGVDGGVNMAARVRAYGAILAIGASGGPSEFERRPLRPDLPTIDIIFVEQGEFAYLEGDDWVSSRGPLMIAPSGLPNRVRFTSDWAFTVVRVPRQAVLRFVPMLTDNVRIFPTLTVPERAMMAFLQQSITSEDPVSPGDSRTVDHVVLEMAGTLLRERNGDLLPLGSPQAVLRDRMMVEIARRSTDPQFDPAGLAREAGVSLRHLQSIFSQSGTSLAGEIRRERARVARSSLQDPRLDALPLREIAARSGFGSSASMRRALNELYRLNPRDLRARRV